MSELILRAIKTERLPDDEQDDDWQGDEEKAKPVSLFSKAKAAITGSRVVSAAKQAASLSKLREVEQRRLQLIEWDKAEEQAATELLNELLSQNNAPSRDGDLETFKAAQKEYLRRDLDLSPKIKALREWIGGLMRVATINRGQGGDISKLKSEFPELKTILADAVCGKAAELNATAEQIAKTEQARLDKEHGAGEFDAEDSMPVKRAKANVDYINTLVQRFTSEPVESLYLDVVRYLLL